MLLFADIIYIYKTTKCYFLFEKVNRKAIPKVNFIIQECSIFIYFPLWFYLLLEDHYQYGIPVLRMGETPASGMREPDVDSDLPTKHKRGWKSEFL